MIGRFGGPPAAAGVKFSFWRSMGDLARLVMRSGAPWLRTRIAVALGLVFIGKFAGVWAPVMLGDAISGLKGPDALVQTLSQAFLVGVLGYAGLNLISTWTP